MKIAKPRLDYIFLIYVPFALIGICLIAFAMHATLIGIKWLMLSYFPICLTLAWTPIADKKLLSSVSIKPKSNWRWLLHILLLQLGVLLIFTAFTQANIHLLSAANPLDQTDIILLTNHYWQTSLLPWSWIILLSIALAYFGKKQNQPALLLTAVKPIIRFFADNIIGIGIEIFIRQTLQIASSFTFAILTLFLADLISGLLGLPSLLLANNHAFILSIVIFIMISISPFMQFTRWLWQKHFSESTYWFIFCSLLFALLLIANIILNVVDPYLTNVNLPSLTFSLFDEQNWFIQLQLINYCWWIGLIPLLATTVAHLNRGHTIRLAILANLLLPMTLAIGGITFESYNPEALTNLLTAWLTYWPITLIVGLASLILAAYFYRNPDHCNIANMSKARPHFKLTYLRNTWHLSALFVVVYLISQLRFIYIFNIAITIPVLATLFVAIIGAAFVAIQNYWKKS